MTFTPIFIDGAEAGGHHQEGAIGLWDLVSGPDDITFDQSIVSYSDYSYKFDVSAATAYLQYRGAFSNGNWTDVVTSNWLTFHLYVGTLPGEGLFMKLHQANGLAIPKGYLRMDETGGLQIATEGESYQAIFTTLEIEKWYIISIESNATQYGAYVYDRNSGALIDSDTRVTTSSDLRTGLIGPVSSTGVIYIDNIVIANDATGNDPMVALDERYAVEMVVPNSDGFVDEWDTGDWSDIDEIPEDGDIGDDPAGTTRTYTGTAAAAFTHGVNAFSAQSILRPQTIHAVMVMVYMKISSTVNSSTCLARIRSGTEDSDSGYDITADTLYKTICNLQVEDPNLWEEEEPADRVWTPTNVNNIEIGVITGAVAGAKIFTCTTVYCSILYTGRGGGGQSIIIG